MGLGLYTAADPATLISSNDTFTNPLLITMDGKAGGAIQKLVYVRNSDATKSYLTIQITPSYPGDPSFIDGTEGITYKLYAGATQPTDEQWALTSSVNTISLGDLGTVSVSNTTTYLPFWVRVQIPRYTDIQTIRGIKLNVNANEVLI